MMSAVMHDFSSASLSSSPSPPPSLTPSSLTSTTLPHSLLLHCANQRAIVSLFNALNDSPPPSSTAASDPAPSESTSLIQSHYPHMIKSFLARTSPPICPSPNNIGASSAIASHISNIYSSASTKAASIISKHRFDHHLLLLLSALTALHPPPPRPVHIFTLPPPFTPTTPSIGKHQNTHIGSLVTCLLNSPAPPKFTSVCICNSPPSLSLQPLQLLQLLPPLSLTLTALHLPNFMPTASQPVYFHNLQPTYCLNDICLQIPPYLWAHLSRLTELDLRLGV
jgi:hypothetical protein